MREGKLQIDRALKRLQDHHDTLAEMLDNARVTLLGSDLPESAQVAKVRWELMRGLREYQLFKHHEIFDPLIRSGHPRRKPDAEALKQRCLAVAAKHAEHVHRWTLYGLVDAWPQYRTEALALSELIRAHLEQELADTRRLLAGMERTRQP